MKRLSFALAGCILLASQAAHADAVHFLLGGAGNAVKIEIPAPLETTRAKLSGVRGDLNVDLADPLKTTGTIEADLNGIEGYSFSDADKNKTQTEHMRNWFEIGNETPQDMREKNRWAKFAITKIVKAAAAPNTSKFTIEAQGDFTVHGITKPKTVELEATLSEDKKSISIATKKPFVVSLKEHDVKPRDTAGKFLDGALKVVGLKLSDEAQVSLELKAATK